MKALKLFVSAAAAVAMIGGLTPALAQTGNPANPPAKGGANDNTTTADKPLTATFRDGVTMREGKMMMMKDGKAAPMDSDMTLSNGTRVMRDGKVVHKDGKTSMFKNGEMMDMSGTVQTDSALTKGNPTQKK